MRTRRARCASSPLCQAEGGAHPVSVTQAPTISSPRRFCSNKWDGFLGIQSRFSSSKKCLNWRSDSLTFALKGRATGQPKRAALARAPADAACGRPSPLLPGRQAPPNLGARLRHLKPAKGNRKCSHHRAPGDECPRGQGRARSSSPGYQVLYPTSEPLRGSRDRCMSLESTPAPPTACPTVACATVTPFHRAGR